MWERSTRKYKSSRRKTFNSSLRSVDFCCGKLTPVKQPFILNCVFSFILTFHSHLPVWGSGSCNYVSISPWRWPIPLIFHSFMSRSDNVFPSQPGSSSRALPLHLHFGNCSNIFGFLSSFHMPEPFHIYCDRFHLCFFLDLISSRLTPIAYSTMLNSCRPLLFISFWRWPCFIAGF